MPEIHPLALRASQLHYDLVEAGLYETGHLMHKVVQKIGYEIAESPHVKPLPAQHPTGDHRCLTVSASSPSIATAMS